MVTTTRSPYFLDTAYLLALVNTRDPWHQQAIAWEQMLARERRPLLTTEFVLIELADALATVRFRRQAVQIIAALRASALVEIVPLSSVLLADALVLYDGRADKDWGSQIAPRFV